mgnify:CR=1 FL=1
MGNFKELLVWKKSIEFVTEIYEITASFPSEEKFGLVSQIRRSAVSIPSNIAEGNARRSSADYIQFLKIARGSGAEVETQIIISKNLGFIEDVKSEELTSKITEIMKMINGLINYLKTKP